MGILAPDDDYYMGEALREARMAAAEGEIPVGAVVVAGDSIIARTHNQTEMLHDVTAHAEMLAITAAAEHLGAKYLTGCTLFVTLEPCVMCTGACIQARLSRIVFGAYDPKAGCCGSVTDLTALHLDSEPDIFGGIMEKECEALLERFFASARSTGRQIKQEQDE